MIQLHIYMGFPGGSVVKNLPASAGDTGLIPRLGRSPGEGNENPLQHSCLGYPRDRGAWKTAVHGVAKESDMTQQLNNKNIHTYVFFFFIFFSIRVCHRPLNILIVPCVIQ